MTLEMILKLLSTTEGKVISGVLGFFIACMMMFWIGRLSAPTPDRAVICEPMLEEIQRIKKESTECSARVVEATTACVKREQKACEERQTTRTNIMGSRACEVCDALRQNGGVTP